MKVSASIELLWQLASRESFAAEFKEIEPDHMLEAVLKFVELPVNDLERIGAGAEAVKVLTADVSAIREELEERSIDGTRLRRELRAQIGKGGCPYPGGTIHRSQASRELFNTAAKLADDAGSETLTAKHPLAAILASPTPKTNQVLGGAAGPKIPEPSKTPLLDEHGQDLTRLAVEGKLSAISDRQAECKALLQVLGRKDRKSVLLVSESEDAARSVVVAAAQVFVSKNTPRELKGRRIVNITNVAASGENDEKAARQFMELLAEAATAREVVLFAPAIEVVQGSKKPEERVDLIKSRLKGGAVQCICRVAPQAYEMWVKKDSAPQPGQPERHVRLAGDRRTKYERDSICARNRRGDARGAAEGTVIPER